MKCFLYVMYRILNVLFYYFRFLEARYTAYLSYPVGITGPSKSTVRKQSDGSWLMYDKRTTDWIPLPTDATVTKNSHCHRLSLKFPVQDMRKEIILVKLPFSG